MISDDDLHQYDEGSIDSEEEAVKIDSDILFSLDMMINNKIRKYTTSSIIPIQTHPLNYRKQYHLRFWAF